MSNPKNNVVPTNRPNVVLVRCQYLIDVKIAAFLVVLEFGLVFKFVFLV